MLTGEHVALAIDGMQKGHLLSLGTFVQTLGTLHDLWRPLLQSHLTCAKWRSATQ
jgi:hypothetical protein